MCVPLSPTLSMNLKVGQCVSPTPFSAARVPVYVILDGAGEAHCPTLTPARFRGSKHELLIRGILSPRFAGGEREKPPVADSSAPPSGPLQSPLDSAAGAGLR